MLLQYTSPDNSTIQATLDAGETLGNHTGPATIFVPTDPANREYADILERGLEVEAWVPPRPSPEELQTVRVADPESPSDAVNLRTLEERLAPLQAEVDTIKQERR